VTLYPEEDRAEVVFKFPESATVSLSSKAEKATSKNEGVVYPLVVNISTTSEEERHRKILEMRRQYLLKPRVLA